MISRLEPIVQHRWSMWKHTWKTAWVVTFLAKKRKKKEDKNRESFIDLREGIESSYRANDKSLTPIRDMQLVIGHHSRGLWERFEAELIESMCYSSDSIYTSNAESIPLFTSLSLFIAFAFSFSLASHRCLVLLHSSAKSDEKLKMGKVNKSKRLNARAR